MNIKKKIKNWYLTYLNKKGYELVPKSLIYEWQKYKSLKPSFNKSNLPEDTIQYLKPDNKRLIDLKDIYKKVYNHSHLLWTEEHVRNEDLINFRGDNAYVWQLRGANMNIMGYALTTYYIKSIDKFGLLDKLDEDDYFGNYTFKIDGKVISRDLLDSINEIYFLEKNLGISSKTHFNVLDIGAGYGRLAHRMVSSYANLKTYYCADAVPVSSFIAEYYLHFRGLNDHAHILPLDQINNVLSNEKVDIALNIHSFSECSIQAVDWWISILEKYKIKYLMIVPNVYTNSEDLLVSHDRQSISKVLQNYGYKLLMKEPKFLDPIVQKYGINPTHYYIFQLV